MSISLSNVSNVYVRNDYKIQEAKTSEVKKSLSASVEPLSILNIVTVKWPFADNDDESTKCRLIVEGDIISFNVLQPAQDPGFKLICSNYDIGSYNAIKFKIKGKVTGYAPWEEHWNRIMVQIYDDQDDQTRPSLALDELKIMEDKWTEVTIPIPLEDRVDKLKKIQILFIGSQGTANFSIKELKAEYSLEPAPSLTSASGVRTYKHEGADYICVIWDAVEGAVGYRIQRKDKATSQLTAVYVEKERTNYLDYLIEPGKDYEYEVGAYRQRLTGIVTEFPEPKVFSLEAYNYPNPFLDKTTIRFVLPEEAVVTIKIYNLAGERVETLMDSQLKTFGVHEVSWKAEVAGGVYCGVVEAKANSGKTYEKILKMAVIK